jgi:hypothetical protein
MLNEFFPYRYSQGGVQLQVKKEVLVDGSLHSSLVNDDERMVDLIGLPTWGSVEFDVEASIHQAVPASVLPPDEKESRPWKAVLVLASRMGNTRQVGWRQSQPLSPTDPERLTWKGRVLIRREEVGAWMTIRCLVTRASPRSAPFAGFADESALRLSGSEEWALRIEPKAPSFGAGMRVEWINFRTAPRDVLNENSKCLYYLDLDQPQPVLLLNEDIRDLKTVLSTEGRTGARAAIRDALFMSIAQPVWMALVLLVAGDCDQETDQPEWQGKILEEIAPYAYKDYSEEMAVARLREDMCNPAARALLLQRLGPAVQSYLQVDKSTARVFRDILAPRS